MELLKRENAVAAIRFEKIQVDVTEWGEVDPETGKQKETFVYVRELSAREKDQFEAGLVSLRGTKHKLNLDNLRARMAVLVCCDAESKAIFSQDDVGWLTDRGCRPLTRIYNAAKRLNELSDEDEEELLKN
jgi:hypothetical protein